MRNKLYILHVKERMMCLPLPKCGQKKYTETVLDIYQLYTENFTVYLQLYFFCTGEKFSILLVYQ